MKDTYFNRASADADMVGGRFKKATEASVTGTPTYPTPPSGPWATPDPSGPEPPLGYEIDALPELGGAPAASALADIATPSGGGLSSTSPPDDPPPLSRMRRRV